MNKSYFALLKKLIGSCLLGSDTLVSGYSWQTDNTDITFLRHCIGCVHSA